MPSLFDDPIALPSRSLRPPISDLSPAAPGRAALLPWSLDRQRLTVVIPTYNRRESLRRCLRGLLECEVGSLSVDVRIVDDGSSDGTADMVRELWASYSGPLRLHYELQANAGPGAARNRAIRASDTDLILFLDDDCVPERGWLQGLARAEWTPDLGAVGGKIVSPETGNRISRYCRYIRFNEFPLDDGPVRFVNTANAAFQRAVLFRIGLLEPSVSGGGEAHDLSDRIQRAGYRLDYQPDAVVLHYHRETLSLLVRTFVRMGYRRTLRMLLWRASPPPRWIDLLRLSVELFQSLFRLALLPLHAARLRREGVPGKDALAFAAINWLRRSAMRWGRLKMSWHILTGRQKVEWTSHPPEADRQVPPSPAR